MSESRKILKTTGLISVLTLLSRFTGLARDIVISAKLGTSLAADVFYFAFELPNLARRILGEGALSSIVVPLFTGRRAEGGESAGWLFFNRALNAIGLLTLVLTAAGMIFSAQVFHIFGGIGIAAGAEGAMGSEGGAAMAGLAIDHGVELTRLMFPYMIGLALASLMMGVCHALNSFVAPAMGSVVLNLTMIAAAGASIIAETDDFQATTWLAWAVLGGAAIRMAIMIPTLRARGWRWSPVLSARDPELRKMFSMMTIGLLGLSVSHINIAVIGVFAGFLGPGNKTALVMANRLVQLPMALTATAMATAMLPRLSRLLLEGNEGELRRVMNVTKRIELVFMLPAMVGLMVFGLPIIQLLLERGQWTEESTARTFGALLFYAPGLIPLGWSRLLIPLFHARKDVLTPVKAAGAALVVNLALATGMTMFTDLGQRGLALSTTIAAFVNFAMLSWYVRAKLGLSIGDARLPETFTKCLAAAVISIGGAAIMYRALITGTGEPMTTLSRAACLLPLVGSSAVAYFLLVRLFRVPDASRALDMIGRRLRR